MTRKMVILLAAGGSAALLLAAWGFQYLGGLAPCAMCIWQRWPHLAAAVIGPVAAVTAGPLLPLLGAASAATTGAIGIFHTGVERGWWEGPSTCTSGSIEGLSSQELMDQILTAPLVQCDQVAWEMLGLSMASWNAAASFAFAALWLFAARQRSID
ncbi:MAG: disulfide bond formation protein B [Pseudomonadota bacterium]